MNNLLQNEATSGSPQSYLNTQHVQTVVDVAVRNHFMQLQEIQTLLLPLKSKARSSFPFVWYTERGKDSNSQLTSTPYKGCDIAMNSHRAAETARHIRAVTSNI